MNIISLDEDHKKILEKIVVSENVPETIRKRAQILLCKAKGFTSEQVAEAIGAQAQEIFFTSGGTEADNLAILGGASAQKRKGNHLITTKIEHPAVLEPFKYLEKES